MCCCSNLAPCLWLSWYAIGWPLGITHEDIRKLCWTRCGRQLHGYVKDAHSSLLKYHTNTGSRGQVFPSFVHTCRESKEFGLSSDRIMNSILLDWRSAACLYWPIVLTCTPDLHSLARLDSSAFRRSIDWTAKKKISWACIQAHQS